MSEISKQANRSTAGVRKRRLLSVVVPAALVVVAAGGYAVTRGQETVAAGIGCYVGASTEAETSIVAATGQSPTAICADLWARGEMVEGETEAPPLVACAAHSAVHVFPSSDAGICSSFAMTVLPDDYETAATRFSEMRDDLVKGLSAVSETTPCVSPDRARALATSALRRHGFVEWSVVDGAGLTGEGFDAARPCANSVAFDDIQQHVILVPEA